MLLAQVKEEVSTWQYRRRKCPAHVETREDPTIASSLCPDLQSAPTPHATRWLRTTVYVRFAASTAVRRFLTLRKANLRHAINKKDLAISTGPFCFVKPR